VQQKRDKLAAVADAMGLEMEYSNNSNESKSDDMSISQQMMQNI
jgi:hypothetical protein